jgi:hypothetical protein
VRTRLALALAALLVAAGAAPAQAYWAAGGAGMGLATAQALGAGQQPAWSVSGGSVTVTWAQTPFHGSWVGTFVGGGYVVRRYPGAGGVAVMPNAGCAGTVTGATAALSCVEAGVAPGFWRYTVTPMLSSWTGAESDRSGLVPVPPAPPALDPAVPRNPAPGVAVGDVDLAWSASPGATGYNVYRRAISGFFDFSAPLNGAVPLTVTTYSDPGSAFAGATTYAYVVRAVTDTIESANSDERSVIPFVRPPAPATVTAAPAPAAAIAISWSGVAGVAGYAVHRRAPAGAYDYATPLNGATPLTATTFSDATSVDGASYHYVVRAIAPGAGGVPIESFDSTETAVVTADGVAPSAATMDDPGSPLRGTVTVAGSAADAGSGVASLRFQHRAAGGSTWTDGCVATGAPFSCALDTTAITDGLHDLRALAVDAAGNVTASSVVTDRRIDNTGPTVVVGDPGPFVRATITVSATAADAGSGLASVVVQLAAAGSGTWADVCSSASSPASCPLNTTTLADGGYDLRAIATDAAGNATTSALLAGRVVDNTVPTGVDIQTTNVAGGTAAKPETGDVLTYTFSEPMLPGSILAGWSGAATPVVVRFDDGNPDVITVYDAANSVQLALGGVAAAKKYVDASMTFTGSTAVLSGSAISITLGTPSGPTERATGTSRLEWTTSVAATDRAGNPLVGATVSESGGGDLDF